MRSAHTEVSERESIKHPVSGDAMELGEYDRSLADILHDKEEQDLFINRYLYDSNPDEAKEIAESLADGIILTPKQTKLLEDVREKYNLRCAQIEKIQEGMTPEELIRVGDLDPRIKEVIGKVGAEKATELLSTQFQELALTDSKAFNRITKSLQALHGINTGPAAARLDHDISESLNDLHISEDAYTEATREGNSSKTQENLQKIVAEQFGFFRKSVDFVTGGGLSHRGARELNMQFQEQQKLLAECDKHRTAIGKVLRGTLNHDVNLAMQKYMLEGGEIKDHQPKETIETLADYKKMKDHVQGMSSRWEKYKTDEKKRLNNVKDWSQQTAAFEDMKERFANNEMQDQRKQKARGTLAALLALLFNCRTKDTIKDELK